MSSESLEIPEEFPNPNNEQLFEYIRNLQKQITELEREVEKHREFTLALDGEKPGNFEINYLIKDLTGDKIKNYKSDPLQNRELVSDFNDRFSELESTVARHASVVDDLDRGQTDGPDEAWHAVLEAARRLSDHPDHSVAENSVLLYRENIAQATGRSERMASNYIERFGDRKSGASYRPYERASGSNNNSTKKKALRIELDVWGNE